MQSKVTINGHSVSLVVSDGTIYTEGDFSGNIDLTVTVSPSAERQGVIDNLRLRLPGSSELLDVLGSGEEPTGVSLTFYTAKLVGAASVPNQVDVVWAPSGAKLGSIGCSKG